MDALLPYQLLHHSVLELDYRDHVVIDSQLYRPSEINLLMGNCTKGKAKLGWNEMHCGHSRSVLLGTSRMGIAILPFGQIRRLGR